MTAKRKIKPVGPVVRSLPDVMQRHYNRYIDEGHSHAEYVLNNTLTEEESDRLLSNYMAARGKRA
jgi:hypothetical protein